MIINVFGFFINPEKIVKLDSRVDCVYIDFAHMNSIKIENKTIEEVANEINKQSLNENQNLNENQYVLNFLPISELGEINRSDRYVDTIVRRKDEDNSYSYSSYLLYYVAEGKCDDEYTHYAIVK